MLSGVRVYEEHFEWLLNLNPNVRRELDDAGSLVYFKKIAVTPDDEREWFKAHPQWSKSNRYAGRKGCVVAFPSCLALCGYDSETISFTFVGRHFPRNMALQSEKPKK